MSRLLPEQLQLSVSTTGFTLRLLDWRGRMIQQVHQQSASRLGPEPKDWPIDLAALKQQFATRTRTLRVVLSTAWTRFALIPWSAHAITAEERRAVAAAVIADTYGEHPGGWQVELASGDYGQPTLACALPAQLVAGLDTSARAAGLGLRSLRPVFSGLPSRAVASKPLGLLACYQEGKLDLCLVRRGQIEAYRSYRTSDPASNILQVCHSWATGGDAPAALHYWGDVPIERAGIAGQGLELVQMQLLDGFMPAKEG